MTMTRGALTRLNDAEWEMMWAPYDEPTYQAVLAHIQPHDVVLDIGAGDLRLALRMAKIAKRVYAVELQPTILWQGFAAIAGALPQNLTILCGDARELPFPPNITVGVLLMRHCLHFQLYAEKLKTVGAQKLITNARWRLGVEIIPLSISRPSYSEIPLGWYACWCGATGFKCGPAEQLTPENEEKIFEVRNCPNCHKLAEVC
jgi:SAM-dependent methyltransferase